MAPAIVNTTLQATFLSVVSNVLAQAIQAYRAAKPFVLNTTPVIHFIIYTLINVPPNYLWQSFLEEKFPGFTVVPTVVEGREKEKQDGKPAAEIIPEKKLNLQNTAIKFALDNTLGALVNTPLFVATMSALQGADAQTVIASVKKDTWPLMLAGYKLWPLVSILSFTLIPVQHRIIFGSMVGIGWGVFLSLFASH